MKNPYKLPCILIISFFISNLAKGQFHEARFFGDLSPTSIHFVDLNNDNKMDLLTSNIEGNSLVWYESISLDNQYDKKHVIWNIPDNDKGFGGQKAWVADMDNDGDLDIISSNNLGAYILENLDGKGNFILKEKITRKRPFFSPTDLNQDNLPDIIFLSTNGNTYINYQEANGWSTQLITSKSNNFSQLVDFDFDNDLDFVAISENELYYIENLGTSFNTNEILLGINVPDLNRFQFIDVDNDSDLDIVFRRRNSLHFILNLGNGNYADEQLISDKFFHDSYTIFQTFDFNDDGFIEIVTGNEDHSNDYEDWNLYKFDVVQNKFIKERTIINNLFGTVYNQPQDINNDGREDIIFFDNYNQTISFLNSPPTLDGQFVRSDITQSNHVSISYLNPCDVDNDGDLDMLAKSRSSADRSFGGWYENKNGLGDFRTHHKFKLGMSRCFQFYFEDVLSQLDNEIFSSRNIDTIDIQIPLNELNYTVHSSMILSGYGNMKIHFSDLDADGDLDIIPEYTGDKKLIWIENNQTTLDQWVVHDLTNGNVRSPKIVIEDIDQDGDPDIAFHSSNSSLFGWLQNSQGNFNFKELNNSAGLLIDVADYNNDGFTDILFNENGKSYYYSFHKSIDNPTKVSFNPISTSSLIGNISKAGNDVISLGQFGKVLWYRNNGNDKLGSRLHFVHWVLGILTDGGIADINGDGFSDYFSINGNGNQLKGYWFPNSNKYATISGRCYQDMNENEAFDDGDIPIQNQRIYIASKGKSVVTNKHGIYKIPLFPESYSIQTKSNSKWDLISQSEHEVDLTLDDVNELDFIFNPKNISQIIIPELVCGQDRCKNTNICWVTLENIGTVAANGNATIKLPNNVSIDIQNSSPEFNIVGQNITWNFDELKPTGTRTFPFAINLPSNTFNGQRHTYEAEVKTLNAQGGIVANNTKQFIFNLDCPPETDKIQVSPARGNNNPITKTEELTYSILFQNEEGHPVNHIRIEHIIPSNTEISSFRFISASHPVKIFITDENILVAEFDSLDLPDVSTDIYKSQGFIRFAFTPSYTVDPGDFISVFGSVQFDYNGSIRTHFLSNVIVENIISSVESENQEKTNQNTYIPAIPNPSRNFIRFDIDLGKYEVSFIDLKGIITHKRKYRQGQIDVSTFIPGYYYVLIHDLDNNKLYHSSLVITE